MKFECIKCDYCTTKKGNYDKHLTTQKHLKIFKCTTCDTQYTTKSGLWKHTSQCNNKNIYDLMVKQQEENIKKQNELLEQIKEQQQHLKELIPKINTPKININVFLQENCKDAINWSEFLNMLEIKMYNYELSNNISENIIRTICMGIHQLGVYKRPIHCIDLKRKKMCIKQDNNWEYDMDIVEDTLKKTHTAIHQRYIHVLKQWEYEHPSWFSNEQETEEYTQLRSQIMTTVDDDKCKLELLKQTLLP
jgi:hypothetical protein